MTSLTRAIGRRLYAQPYLLLTLTPLMWAGNAVAGRALVGEVSPMVTTLLRWLLVLVLLAVVARRQIVAERRLLARHWRFVLVMGAVGFTGFNAPLYLGATTTTAVNIGMIQGVMPALVLAGSFLAYRTPFTPLQVAGLLVAIAGVAVTVSHGDLALLRALQVRPGDLWVLFACALYAGYTVALRRRPPISALAFFAGLSLAAFVSTLPLVAAEMATGLARWPGPKGWAILGFLAVGPSFVSQIFYMRGVELIGPGRAGLFVNLVPVFAALLAVLILGETFAAYHAVALALVLAGIALAEVGRPHVVRGTG
ncbi:DMT family transporter [Enterovirga aerilata]|uniref:DMT family transporter n=1 Tax=Enterovirga aerilata TaxID=2730920 RepID=A0A849I4N5_9HYPH|nr:DMT family transporter [Enterovirga sp. DB1703]NNM74796.1 DMT family transporter [Enterovirga sp. DB1703]